MKSFVSDGFRKMFARLPDDVKEKARKNYRLWKADPTHPSLHFKRVHSIEPLFSVRVGVHWRAVGLFENDAITWIWIGSHSDYDRLLRG